MIDEDVLGLAVVAEHPLQLAGLALTTLLRGRKVMHLPSESVAAGEDEVMEIDFPDADLSQPTQCPAVAIAPTPPAKPLTCWIIDARSPSRTSPSSWPAPPAPTSPAPPS